MDRVFYFKIGISLVVAFIISSVLNVQFFLSGTPHVRADLGKKVAEKTDEALSLISHFQISSLIREQNNRSGGAPTSAIFPTTAVTTAPTFFPNPTEVQNTPIQPTPTVILSRPTDRVLPTTRPTTVPTVRPTTAPQPSDNISITALERDTINLINQRRKAAGVGELAINGALTQAARRHSADMSSHGSCNHTGSDGSDFVKRTNDAGYKQAYGETLACRLTTAQAAVDGWWNSPPHKAILTNGGVKNIGLGWGGSYATAVVGY